MQTVKPPKHKSGWTSPGDCEYLAPKRQAELQKGYEEVGRMLGKMMSMPEKFIPSNQRREE